VVGGGVVFGGGVVDGGFVGGGVVAGGGDVDGGVVEGGFSEGRVPGVSETGGLLLLFPVVAAGVRLLPFIKK
jgi:hypothetical protein